MNYPMPLANEEKKTCRCCGTSYTRAEWSALPSLRTWVLEGFSYEMAECVGRGCQNTLIRETSS